MIQRIQSVYLFTSGVVTGLALNYLKIWDQQNLKWIVAKTSFFDSSIIIKTIGVGLLLSTGLSFYSLFQFKDRKKQFVINRINIIIQFYLLGKLLFDLLTLPGESNGSEKGIGAFIPAVVIVLLVLANKAIKKDENLVKSVDRLR